VPKSIPKRDIDFIGESLVETINKNYLTMEDIMTDKFTRPILKNLRTSLQDILKAESKSDKIPFELTLGNCSFDEDQA